jgi:hypothetical protein
MPENNLCTCCTCGYTWTRGLSGKHSCSDNLLNKFSLLADAMRVLSIDMHIPSLRPCNTCKTITDLIGFDFGCYAYQEAHYQRGKSKSNA